MLNRSNYKNKNVLNKQLIKSELKIDLNINIRNANQFNYLHLRCKPIKIVNQGN